MRVYPRISVLTFAKETGSSIPPDGVHCYVDAFSGVEHVLTDDAVTQAIFA